MALRIIDRLPATHARVDDPALAFTNRISLDAFHFVAVVWRIAHPLARSLLRSGYAGHSESARPPLDIKHYAFSSITAHPSAQSHSVQPHQPEIPSPSAKRPAASVLDGLRRSSLGASPGAPRANPPWPVRAPIQGRVPEHIARSPPNPHAIPASQAPSTDRAHTYPSPASTYEQRTPHILIITHTNTYRAASDSDPARSYDMKAVAERPRAAAIVVSDLDYQPLSVPRLSRAPPNCPRPPAPPPPPPPLTVDTAPTPALPGAPIRDTHESRRTSHARRTSHVAPPHPLRTRNLDTSEPRRILGSRNGQTHSSTSVGPRERDKT
ncbi:hypothetical protein HETIRDRAFT_457732 [Heterobasidion irregulare TC 32-1]|uniref:Uncharacterized protein n=1 Tax=Heterobasidion irregulare (strain TC 32-1) TaxID=747525 RepID=W4KKG2_HETIT|nr:uncharacterized protein HETIRDRAFT_457732 [Heterobasidion irregulare TC 32-1]ETW86328.1 hypothetical protein HETIRDRAFT_457732 [Heterobasidion irregulare TC 32-1]